MIDIDNMGGTDRGIDMDCFDSGSLNGNNDTTFLFTVKFSSSHSHIQSGGQNDFICGISNGTPSGLVSLDFHNPGGGTNLRCAMNYTSFSSATFNAAALGLTDHDDLQDKWAVIAIQYRGSSTAHKAYIAFHNGTNMVYFEATAGGNTGVLGARGPAEHFYVGNVNGAQTSCRPDACNFAIIHDEDWALSDFTNVANEILDTDGTPRSPFSWIHLNTGARGGAANVEAFGPVHRGLDANVNGTAVSRQGEIINNGDKIFTVNDGGAIDSCDANIFGSGNPRLLSYVDLGFTADTSIAGPTPSAAGSRYPGLKELVASYNEGSGINAFTARRRFLTHSNSRGTWTPGDFDNDDAGYTLNPPAGRSYDSTVYPGGKTSVPGSYVGGLALQVQESIVGTLALEPQLGYTNGSGLRHCGPGWGAPTNDGWEITGRVIGRNDGSGEDCDEAVACLGWSSRQGPGTYGSYTTMGSGNPIRLKPGEYVVFQFEAIGAMDFSLASNPVNFRTFIADLPGYSDTSGNAVAGSGNLNLTILGHGSTNATLPTGAAPRTYDYTGSAASRPRASGWGINEPRGGHNSPTMTLTGTSLTLTGGADWGDDPQVGDMIVFKSASQPNEFAVSRIASVNGSNNYTLEKAPSPNSGDTFASPTCSWGIYDVAAVSHSLQVGEPNADRPFLFLKVECDASSADPVYLHGAECYTDGVSGSIWGAIGEGGAGETDQESRRFSTVDANGMTPHANLIDAMGITGCFKFPAEQNSSPSDITDTTDVLLAGQPEMEIYLCGRSHIAKGDGTIINASGTSDAWGTYFLANLVGSRGAAASIMGSWANNWAIADGQCYDGEHFGSRGSDAIAKALYEQFGTLSDASIGTTTKARTSRAARYQRVQRH